MNNGNNFNKVVRNFQQLERIEQEIRNLHQELMMLRETRGAITNLLHGPYRNTPHTHSKVQKHLRSHEKIAANIQRITNALQALQQEQLNVLKRIAKVFHNTTGWTNFTYGTLYNWRRNQARLKLLKGNQLARIVEGLYFSPGGRFIKKAMKNNLGEIEQVRKAAKVKLN